MATPSLIDSAAAALYSLESRCRSIPPDKMPPRLPAHLTAARDYLYEAQRQEMVLHHLDDSIRHKRRVEACRKLLTRNEAQVEKANARVIALHVEIALSKAGVVASVAVAPVSAKKQAQLDRQAELKARMIAEREPAPKASIEEIHATHYPPKYFLKWGWTLRTINRLARKETLGICFGGGEERKRVKGITEAAAARMYTRYRPGKRR